jgi:hypothetical protein
VDVSFQELGPTSAELQMGGEAIQSMADLQHRIIATDEPQPLKPENFGYGSFTRYGDVLPLLTQTDDKFAIMRYADQMEVTFPAPLPPRPGMKRGFILKADLYYKEFNSSKALDPLPFHGMSTYPYPATESYPADADHYRYRQQYNTRQFDP